MKSKAIHQTTAQTVDEYIVNYPSEVQKMLQTLRDLIQRLAPDAQEIISYQMPAYKLHGSLVYFAAFKNHIGFYPTASGIETFKHKLSNYTYAKGSVQFPLDKPLPLDLIAEIVTFRVEENLQKAKRKMKQKKSLNKTKKVKDSKAVVQEQFPKIAKPALRALENAGLRQLDDLTGISEGELSKLHGMGPKAITILRQALAKKDLSFLDDC